MYHIFFIHLSVDEHLGCFHDLAIVNSAAIKGRTHLTSSIRYTEIGGGMNLHDCCHALRSKTESSG